MSWYVALMQQWPTRQKMVAKVDKAGLDRYQNVAKDAGLTVKEAPHSLRYAYSRKASEWHMKNGLSRKEAEAMVSMDLWHGDGRGYFI